MDIDLKDKICSQCLGIPLEWFWWRGRSNVGFGSLAVSYLGVVQSLPSLEGRWLWDLVLNFSCPEDLLLLLNLPYCFSLPLVSHCLQEHPSEWDFATPAPSWERPSPSSWVPQGKTGPPPPPSLWREHLPAAYWSLGCCCRCQDTTRDMRAWGKLNHHPLHLLCLPEATITPWGGSDLALSAL